MSTDDVPGEGMPPVDRAARYDPAWPASVDIFDTTLRDGAQFEGISLTVEDKLAVARALDELGVHWIEGGYPGANPKDEEFFRRARTELDLSSAQLVAFGSTRKPLGRSDDDPTLRTLVEAGVTTACIVGKSWDYHVLEALRTTLDEGVAMVGESVAFLRDNGLRVFFDAEHFFDGYKRNPEFALRVLEAAAVNGAHALVLCDTNGGSLPHEIEPIVRDVVRHFGGVQTGGIQIGIHTQNDTGCAVPNAIAAVIGGATQVQVTMNGYGERTGNCDLVQLVPNLTLKMGIRTLPEGHMERLTEVSRRVAELVNLPHQNQLPYVGQSAFAHKAGLHTSAIARRPDSYEHVDPGLVGNGTRFLVSDLSGRATMEFKAKEWGIELDGKQLGAVLEQLKHLESAGYHFETADASLELLMRRATGWRPDYVELESFRVTVEHRPGVAADLVENPLGHAHGIETECTIKLLVNGDRVIATGEGNGPVNALDAAFRAAVGDRYPQLGKITLTDFKVRVLNTEGGTGAVVRVLIESSNGERKWTTMGVSENVIEASWQALMDGVNYGLLLTN